MLAAGVSVVRAAPAQGLSAAGGSAQGALTCFTSSRTASRHWEWPSCRMFSFDLARCRGVRPARSRASTRDPARAGRGKPTGREGKRGGQRGRKHIPPRSRVVMTGTWLVQAAEEGEQRLESPGHQDLSLPARGGSRTVTLKCARSRSHLQRLHHQGSHGVGPTPSLYSWGD